MISDREPSVTLAAHAAVTALVVSEANGESKRAAFEAALEAWCEFRPQDDRLEAHERVIPLVLAIEDAMIAGPH